MVKEIIIPKENLAKTEEVGEIENKDLEQKKDENQGSKIVEKLEETILPTVHALDDDENQKEGAKQTIGYALGGVDALNPAVGGVASGSAMVIGGVQGGIGKIAGDEGMAEGGKVVRQSVSQPLKDLGSSIKKIFE